MIYDVHTELGPGLNEHIYQEGLAMQLTEEEVPFEREKEVRLTYHGKLMNATYRLDFLCLGCVVIECKSVEKLTPDHRAQLFNYMRITKSPIGILVNFAQKSAVVERYFFNKDTNEICDTNGDILVFYTQKKQVNIL
jgi:GxxExxY protein